MVLPGACDTAAQAVTPETYAQEPTAPARPGPQDVAPGAAGAPGEPRFPGGERSVSRQDGGIAERMR